VVNVSGDDNLKLTKTNGGANAVATKKFGAQTGLVTMEWDMNYIFGQQDRFQVHDSSGNLVLSMLIQDVGAVRKLQVNNGTNTYVLDANVLANDSYRPQIVFDTTAKTFDVSARKNGSGSPTTFNDITFNNVLASDIVSVKFMVVFGAAGELRIDDLFVH
jgi:hypothetical protein